jgi:PAS domain S-box-containing protein
LQSTNEELETSKEELQSVNEELATVNNELQIKVADLSRANNDMNNLLAGTGIATVFVDHQLRILRFTPAATRIINLILSDIGRPVSHIVSNLAGYDRLPADTQAVLDTLIPKEVDVRTEDGNWYTLRIQPYRTIDNGIEGAVITFVDVTAARKLAEQARKNTDLLNASQRLSRVGGWEWIAETQTMFWTEETYRIHDFTPGEIEPGNTEHIRRSLECYAPEDRPKVLAAFQRCVNEGQPYDLEFPFTTAKGRRLWVRTTARAVFESGKVIRVIGNIMDITERRQAGEALRVNEERLRVALSAAPIVVFNQDRDLRYTWMQNPAPGFSAEQVIGKTDADLLPEEDAAALTAVKQRVLDSGQGTRQQVRTTIGGKPFVYDLSVEPLRDADGAVVGITCASMDVTGQPHEMRIEAGTTRTLPSGKEGEKP